MDTRCKYCLREPAASAAPTGRAVRIAAMVTLFKQPGMAIWGFVVLPLTWAGIGGVYG